jgi:hypothetical protein
MGSADKEHSGRCVLWLAGEFAVCRLAADAPDRSRNRSLLSAQRTIREAPDSGFAFLTKAGCRDARTGPGRRFDR